MSTTGEPDAVPGIPRLIVGLGNPGREYENTRHNIGFMVLDAFATQQGLSWTRERRWNALAAKFSGGWLLKPQTYMNLSGQAVTAAARFYKVQPEEVLAVYDDVDLPLGRMRLRLKGSAGGHNGIRSMIAHLGGDAFPRLKIGVGEPGGRPAGAKLVGHVLGKFQEDEQAHVQQVIPRVLEAINCALTRGMEAAMNIFNQTDQPPTKPNP